MPWSCSEREAHEGRARGTYVLIPSGRYFNSEAALHVAMSIAELLARFDDRVRAPSPHVLELVRDRWRAPCGVCASVSGARDDLDPLRLDPARLAALIHALLRHLSGPKVRVYKMKPKKKTRKTFGSRRKLTRVLISSISSK